MGVLCYGFALGVGLGLLTVAVASYCGAVASAPDEIS